MRCTLIPTRTPPRLDHPARRKGLRQSRPQLERLEARTLLASDPVLYSSVSEQVNGDWPSSPSGAPKVDVVPIMETRARGQLWSTNDVDVVRVDLKQGDILSAALEGVAFWGTYRFFLEDGQGQTIAEKIFTRSFSDPPLTVNTAPTFVFQASQTRSYYFGIERTGGGSVDYNPYTIGLRTIELADGTVDRKWLTTDAQGVYAWLKDSSIPSQDVLDISGPVGYGFGIRGEWQKVVTSSQTSYRGTGTLYIQTPAGELPMPVLPGTQFEIVTDTRGDGLYGEILDLNTDVRWRADLGLGVVTAPFNQSYGFNFSSDGVGAQQPLKAWGLRLGNDPDLANTGAPVNNAVPYLFINYDLGTKGNFGGIELASAFGLGWSLVVDPADPFLYASVRGLPVVNEFAFAGSLHGNIPFSPNKRPSGWGSSSSLFGNVYLKADVDLSKLAGAPLSVNGDLVFDLDANDDGKVLGGVGKSISQVIASHFDKSVLGGAAAALFTDFSVGINAEVRVGFEIGKKGSSKAEDAPFTLTVPVGAGTLIYDGPKAGLFLRGGTVNPFEGTPLEPFAPVNSLDVDSYLIVPTSNFRVTLSGGYKVLGYKLSNWVITADNNGVRANGHMAALGASVNVTGTIKNNGDFLIKGRASANFNIVHGYLDVSFQKVGGSISLRGRLSTGFDADIFVANVGGSLTLNVGIGIDSFSRFTYSGSGTVSFWVTPKFPPISLHVNAGVRFNNHEIVFTVPIINQEITIPLPPIGLAGEPTTPVAPPTPDGSLVPVLAPKPIDLDGDGMTDLGVFDPTTATWLGLYSSSYDTQGNATKALVTQFGAPNLVHVPVPGDYDGDGKTDLAVFEPSDGRWLVRLSGGGVISTQFGAWNLAHIPVPGDYDGDGKTDLAVFDPKNGRWLSQLSGGGVMNTQFGAPNLIHIPVPGDYDGDGKTDLAVFEPSDGRWLVRLSGGGVINTQFGAWNLTHIPVPGDYDGDGKTDLAVFDPSKAQWLSIMSRDAVLKTRFGATDLTHIPLAAPIGSLLRLGLIGGSRVRTQSFSSSRTYSGDSDPGQMTSLHGVTVVIPPSTGNDSLNQIGTPTTSSKKTAASRSDVILTGAAMDFPVRPEVWKPTGVASFSLLQLASRSDSVLIVWPVSNGQLLVGIPLHSINRRRTSAAPMQVKIQSVWSLGSA